jgi:hypothetical protein
MKISSTCLVRLVLILATFFFAQMMPIVERSANAQDLTGTWVGSNILNDVGTTISFSLAQYGDVATGSIVQNGVATLIVGQVQSGQVTLIEYSKSSFYQIIATGTTDGQTMSGELMDTLGAQGSFNATKIDVPLSPTTQLTAPPAVVVQHKTIKVTMQKFTAVDAKTARLTSPSRAEALEAAPASSGLTTSYELTLKRKSDRIVSISKRNVQTIKNLKPGVYSSSYRVSALKKGKKVYTTKKSPTISFVVP